MGNSGHHLRRNTPPSEELDSCGIIDYVFDHSPYHVVLSHEGAGGNSKTVNFNGQPVTYQNLTNATDVGNGVVTFSGGTNGVFNRRASSLETAIKVGDYFEITVGTTGQFDQQYIAFVTDPNSLAEVFNESYRIRFTPSGFQLFDRENVQVASGTTENGIYKVERTLSGFKFYRNSVLFYESPCRGTDEIEDPLVIVNGIPSVHVIGKFEPLAPVVIAEPNISVVTGFDFEQAGVEDMELVVYYNDEVSQRSWSPQIVPLKEALIRFNAGDTVDAFNHIFDNDYTQVNILDLTTGELQFNDVGRELSISRIYLQTRAFTRSKRLGELVHIKSSRFLDDDDAQTQGYLPIKQGTVVNGALSYPLWSAIYTEYIVGNDIVFPADVEGMFLRNLGGNASLEGDFQQYTQRFTPNAPTATQVNSGSGNSVRNRTTGTETRPANRAYQLYTIIDTYVDSIDSGTSTPELEVDVIPEFDASLKTSFGMHEGRPYTCLTDSATTTETADRPYNSIVSPFVEVEILRDTTATHSMYIRANEAGTGRQSQVRVNISTGVSNIFNSGVNTVPPNVIQKIIEEDSIKLLIEFSDPVAHTELEIAPAGANSALVNTPSQTGETCILGLKVYETNPNTNTHPDDDVETITGTAVDNTDPRNPVINLQNALQTETTITGVAPITDNANTQQALINLATAITGLTHTAITNIDLKPTGNANEFVIDITWTDEDGVSQTTTDPTPITFTDTSINQHFAGTLEPIAQLPSTITGWDNVDDTLPATYRNDVLGVTFYFNPAGTAGDLLDPLWDTEWVYKDTIVLIPTQLSDTTEYNQYVSSKRIRSGVELTIRFELGIHTVLESIDSHPDWQQIVFTGVNAPSISINDFANSGFVDAVTDTLTSATTIASDRITNDIFLQSQFQTIINCRVPFFDSNIYGIRRQDMLLRAVDASDNLTISGVRIISSSQECVVLDQRLCMSGGQFGVLVTDGGTYNGFDRVFISGAATGVSNSSGSGFIRLTGASACSNTGASTTGATLIIDDVSGSFFGVNVTGSNVTVTGEIFDCQLEGITATRSDLNLRNAKVLRSGRHGVIASQCNMQVAGFESNYNDNNGIQIQETKMQGVMGNSIGNGGTNIFGNLNSEARLNSAQTGTSPAPNITGNNNTYFIQ